MAETTGYKYIMQTISARSSGVTVDNIIFYASLSVNYYINQYGEKMDKTFGYAVIRAEVQSTALGSSMQDGSKAVSNSRYEKSDGNRCITLSCSYNIYNINHNYQVGWGGSATGEITRQVYANELIF